MVAFRGGAFLTSVSNGGQWSASRPGRFTPWESACNTHWTEGCVGCRAGLEVFEKRRSFGPVRNRTTLPWLFILLPITIPTWLSRLHIHVTVIICSLFIYLFIYLSIYLFIYLFIWVERRSPYVRIRRCVCVCVCVCVCLFMYMCMSICTCMYIYRILEAWEAIVKTCHLKIKPDTEVNCRISSDRLRFVL